MKQFCDKLLSNQRYRLYHIAYIRFEKAVGKIEKFESFNLENSEIEKNEAEKVRTDQKFH